MSASDFESWAETLEVMSDFPDIKEDCEKAHEDLKLGKLVYLENIPGYVSKPKTRKKYGLSRSVVKTRRKRVGKNARATALKDR